jgi:hypothetical protein
MLDKEKLIKDFKETLFGLLKDKEAQQDEEIVDFYMGVLYEIVLTHLEGEED